ncbi:helix-turn-helix domain-containing protein [Mesorhizobium sp. M1006]|uniref:helix-turn-helix domain-containing protein n=1 Tax=Mesorhizobium sp. M1006 TaxID=2957048 RepID=UPI00333BE1C0
MGCADILSSYFLHARAVLGLKCTNACRGQFRPAALVDTHATRSGIDRKNINWARRMSIENLSKLRQTVSTRQIKAARALLGWSQADLARHSSVSEPTIARLEAEDGPLGGRPGTAAKILKALTDAGTEFMLENGSGPGVRLIEARQSPE